jgi:K+-transporting ATPase c subunit
VSSSTRPGNSPGRMVAIAVLAIIALLLIVAGFVYIAVPASSLSVLPGHAAGSTGHHPLRAVGCLILGVVFAVGAWFTMRYKGPVKETDNTAEKTPADL